MTIHFYTFSDRVAPSSRQRTFIAAEQLEKRGIATVIHMPTVLSLSRTPWPRKSALIIELVRSLFSIKKGDVVYLQRAVYSKYFFVVMVVYLYVCRRKTIFDFDDPVYVHNHFKTKVFCKLADTVLVATHRQAEWARQFNHNVQILNFVIDPAPYEKYSKDYARTPARPVIGWLGTGPEHLQNLPILVPVLQRLAQQLSFEFVLIGAFGDRRVYELFENIPNTRFIDKLNYVDAESAPKEVQKFDIGVVPHQMEGEWNQAKTSMKILEYMACGVPAVVSAFGEMPYMVVDGVNGYLASSEDEWVDKLSLLLKDAAVRARIGREGQRFVREKYSFDAMLPQLVQVIHSLQ